MFEKCIDNNVSYGFFDLKTNEFSNKQEKPIQSIFEIVNNPFGIKPILALEENFFGFYRTSSPNREPNYPITDEIRDKLIYLLEKIYQKKIEELEFQENLNRKYINQYTYDFFYTQNDKGNSYVVIKKGNKFIIYNLEMVEPNIVKNYLS